LLVSQDLALYFFKKFILSFLHFLTCVYIIWDPTPTSWQNLFSPLIFRFCWIENMKDKKKNMAFLLIWNKDNYTKRFLELLPRTFVLQPVLGHLYQTSSLLPGPLPIVASVSLRLIYSLLYREDYKPYSSFRFPSLSLFLLCTVSPQCVIHVQQYYCNCFKSIICIWWRTRAFWPFSPD
jgi:hypothetical protein